jgi:hypothetical protein
VLSLVCRSDSTLSRPFAPESVCRPIVHALRPAIAPVNGHSNEAKIGFLDGGCARLARRGNSSPRALRRCLSSAKSGIDFASSSQPKIQFAVM